MKDADATGFIIEFRNDQLLVTAEDGERLLSVVIAGPATAERRNRIADLASRLIAECQEAEVYIAPFTSPKARS